MDAIFIKIGAELRSGNVKKAAELRKEFPNKLDEGAEMELTEIVRQNMVGYAKKGQIDNIILAKKLFSIPNDVVNDIMKHAVLSIFSEGNENTIKALCSGVPIPTEITNEIISYCESWKKADRVVAIKRALA